MFEEIIELAIDLVMEEKERDAAGIDNSRATDRNSETGMDRLKALFTTRYKL